MAHSSYIRVVPDSACAVLLLHGFLGTPRQFDPILDCFPENWSVYNMVLDGHGGTVADFARSGMRKWQAQTDAALDALRRRHEKIIVVAHSMGCLLTLASLLREKSGVYGTLLLAPALCIRVRPVGCINALRVVLDRIPPENVLAAATQKACGVAPEKRLWRYLPALPRFAELLAKARRVRSLLGFIEVPCTVLLSAKDELVGPRTAAYLRGRESFIVHVLKDSGHFYYPEQDLAQLRQTVRELVQQTENMPVE